MAQLVVLKACSSSSPVSSRYHWCCPGLGTLTTGLLSPNLNPKEGGLFALYGCCRSGELTKARVPHTTAWSLTQHSVQHGV
jgi:hypothetical protein